MPVVMRLKNYDELYHRTTSDKVLLNDRNSLLSEEKEALDNLIMRNYADDSLSLVPSCGCGAVTGAYYVGDICEVCGTAVTSSIDDGLAFLVWLKQPEGVAPFVSPIVMSILMNRYKITKPNISLIRYILTPGSVVLSRRSKNYSQLERLDMLLSSHGISKGYNSFVEHFFTIIQILEMHFMKVKKKEKEEFLAFLESNRSNIFSQYLPFPNRVIFAIDSNELGSYIDKSLIDALNAYRRVTGIDLHTRTSAIKQSYVAKTLMDLAVFYKNYMTESFFKKPGLIRKHVSCAKSHFTGRAVITSITTPHQYDEVHLPWSLSCTLFREHILNRLRLRGFSYKKAVNHLIHHNKIWCPILAEIFEEIIESSGEGVDLMVNRNPSLHRGSIQSLRLTRVKQDVDDNTMSLSYLIGKSFNMDFDGDMLNFTLVLTKRAREGLENFRPHHNVLSIEAPNEFSGALSLPKTIVSTLANWFDHNRQHLLHPTESSGG